MRRCFPDGPTWQPAAAWGPLALALAAAGASALAQGTAVEADAVAARFPDPPVVYATPAFEPGRDTFTSNAELRARLHALAADTTNLARSRLVEVGSSQTGLPLEALHLSGAPVGAPRPAVLLIGQQHGDEPAGAEALLVIAQRLAQGDLAPLLDRIDVVILARANPDGAAVPRRASASGIDVNRDHLLLRTPEAQAQAQLVREFNPVVVVDAHEFPALGRYVTKFGAAPRHDALIQYATVANLPGLVTRAAEEWFRQPLRQALAAQRLSSEWYYTTSADPADRRFSMGGVQPDIGRNVHGLRHAVSLLIETRGADLGRAHLLRRVHTHVTAIASVLRSAASRADDLQKLRRFVAAELIAKACRGEMVVEAAVTTSEYTLGMIDPQTGADRELTVAWDSALALTTVQRRPRPCGYWLATDQTDAVLRLRALGVAVQRIDDAGELRGEAYADAARESGVRADARPSIAARAGAGVRLKVGLAPALIDARAGSYYVGLDQPLANLVVAALEPDTQSSYFAHRVIDRLASLGRVLRRPALKMSALP